MRIVSLLPSATEIACALGLGEQLVGVSHECDHPPELAHRVGPELPVLTASILDAGLSPKAIDTAVHEAQLEGRPIYSVDGERLEALAPELILTQGVCSVCAVTPATIETALQLIPVEVLGRAREAQVLSLAAKTFEGVLADIQAVAEAAGVVERGRALVASLRARWAAIAASGPVAPPPSAPAGREQCTAFFLEWPDPPWSAGHWVPEQLAAAGVVDAFGEVGGASRPLPWSAIAAADPDWILAGACGYDLATNLTHARALLERPEVQALRAVREGRVWALDANAMFSRPAPRLVEGAACLRAIFTGQADALPEGFAAPLPPSLMV